jgi:hypothetical protein
MQGVSDSSIEIRNSVDKILGKAFPTIADFNVLLEGSSLREGFYYSDL